MMKMMQFVRVPSLSRRASASIGLIGLVVLSACSGGGELKVGGQKVNGQEEAIGSAVLALGQFGSQTGANVNNATCHLRVSEADNERVPKSVDCLPVGFLGGSGFNTVSFPIGLEPDPESTKDLFAVVHIEDPRAVSFNPETDSFVPAVPESLPQPGAATVPDGYTVIVDRLVKSADLASAQAQAVEAMRADTTHDPKVRFTLANDPTCLFATTLDSIWCGPGVSLVAPEGEIYGAELSVPYLDATTYRFVGTDQLGAKVHKPGRWWADGSETPTLVDAQGNDASLPAVDTIAPPDIPTLEPGHFVEVEAHRGEYTECLATGTPAKLCDGEIDQYLEANPTVLFFTSGLVTIDQLAFGQQTGTEDPSTIIDAARAPEGERLVGLTVTLERSPDVSDSTPLNAQILVNGEVKADFGGATGTRGFFLSAPVDATVSVRLQSDGEDQNLDINGKWITIATERPELYAAPSVYRFSTDQSFNLNGEEHSVEVSSGGGLNDEITTIPWVMRDKQAIVAPKGSLFLPVRVNLEVNNDVGNPTNDCSMSLVLDDGTVLEATDTGVGVCWTDITSNIQAVATFAIAPGTRIRAIQVRAFTLGQTSIPDITIPTVS